MIPVYSVELVRSGAMPWHRQEDASAQLPWQPPEDGTGLPAYERITIDRPADAAALASAYLAKADREHLAAILLDTRNQVIGITTISIGDLSSAIVHPREVFKVAILANSACIIIAHNHPSGDPTPSYEDVQITQRLIASGEIVGIEVVDHIVVGERGRFASLKERGLIAETRATYGMVSGDPSPT